MRNRPDDDEEYDEEEEKSQEVNLDYDEINIFRIRDFFRDIASENEFKAFKVTPHLKDCLMRPEDVEKFRGKEFVILLEDFWTIVNRKVNQEIDNGGVDHERQAASNKAKEIIEKLKKNLARNIESEEKRAQKNIENASVADVSFLKYVQNFQTYNGFERIERLVTNGLGKAWHLSLKDAALASIEKMEQSMGRLFKEAREAVHESFKDSNIQKEPEFKTFLDLLPEEKKRKVLEKQIITSFKGFGKEGMEELKNLKSNGESIIGTGGITSNLISTDFGFTSSCGEITFFDGANGRLAKKLEWGTESRIDYASLEFNPSGSLVLFSNQEQNSLSVLTTEDFKEQQKWERSDVKGVWRARWLDENQVAVVFNDLQNYGLLAIYEVGKKEPVKEFSVSATRVVDFDISPEKHHVYIGTSSSFPPNLVYPKPLGSGHNYINPWQYKAPQQFTAVRVSGNGDYVCCSNCNRHVAVLNTMDGHVVATFKEFASNNVFGVLWTPNSESILAWSQHELVLLRFEVSGVKSLRLLDKIQFNGGYPDLIYGAGVHWENIDAVLEGKSQLTGSFVIMGMANGRLFKVPLI